MMREEWIVEAMGTRAELARDHSYPDCRAALSALGAALDHRARETPVAWCVDKLPLRRHLLPSPRFREGFFLTDQRLHFRDGGTDPVALPLIAIEVSTRRRRLASSSLGLRHSGREHEVVGRAARALEGLLHRASEAASAVEGPYRGSAAIAPHAALIDVRLAQLDALIDAHETGGMDSGDVADLRDRRELLARTLAWGRGVGADGVGQSALAGVDLAVAIMTLVGDPTADRRDGDGVRWLTYSDPGFRNAGEQVAGAVLLGVVGLALAQSRERAATTTHFAIAEVGRQSGFCMTGDPPDHFGLRRTSLEWRLPDLEAQVLLLRILYGWDQPLSDLMRSTPADAAALMERVLGRQAVHAFERGGWS